MRDKNYFNDRLSPTFINNELKQFVEKLSEDRDNSAESVGQHHVINDALTLLYKKKTGKEFKFVRNEHEQQ